MSPKQDIASVLQALVEKVDQIDKRTNAIATTPNRYFVDAPEAAPKRRSAKPPQQTLADKLLKLIKEKPRKTTDLIDLLGTTKTGMWAAIEKLERGGDAVTISMPGESKGRRGPSIVYHSSHVQLSKRLGS